MPESDLTHLKGDYLLKNVALAYKARSATPWAAAVPEELFFRDVLPYASVDERRTIGGRTSTTASCPA